MTKKITIYNYLKKPCEIVIDGIENIVTIRCAVITGDEVLLVEYDNGIQAIYDSSIYQNSLRSEDSFDGEVIIPVDALDCFSSIIDPYEMLYNSGFSGDDKALAYKAAMAMCKA